MLLMFMNLLYSEIHKLFPKQLKFCQQLTSKVDKKKTIQQFT